MHPDGWTIALQTVNFVVLVWLLHRFLYKPVLGMIDARNAALAHQFDDAKATRDRAQAELAAIGLERAAIAAERDAALAAAAAQAQRAADVRRAQAERDAQALLEGGRKTLASERERALDEARGLALDLGAEFARRLLAEVPMPLRAEAWIEQIERRLVTAVRLPAETADAWRDRLRRALGGGTVIAFDVDAALIAGAELHFSTAVLRCSWQATLAELRSQASVHADAE